MATLSSPYTLAAPAGQTRRVARSAAFLPAAAVWAAVAGLVAALIPREYVAAMPRDVVVGITFGLLLALAIIAHKAARKSGLNPWVAPASLLSIYCFIRYGWGTAILEYWEYYPWQAYPHLRWSFHQRGMWENMFGGAQLIVVFALAMFAGGMYSMSRPRSIMPRFSWSFDEAHLKRMLIPYLPVACFINAFLQFGLPVSIKFTIALFGSFLYPVIMLGSYWFFSARTASERTRWGIFVLVGVGGAVPVGLVTGQVNGMLMPVLTAILGYVIARGGPPWKTMLLLAPLMFLFVLPFASIYKYGHGGKLSPEIGPRLENTAKRFVSVGMRGRFELAIERSVLRFAGSNMPILYTRFFPGVYPYEYGKSFWFEASNLIPRVLWPEKPYAAYELNSYPARIGLVSRDGFTTALFDAMSEYYISFGLLGAWAIGILHGMYWHGLYKWLTGKVNPLIGSVLILTAMSQNEDFYGIVMSATSQVKAIPVWLFLFYVFSRKPQRHVAIG